MQRLDRFSAFPRSDAVITSAKQFDLPSGGNTTSALECAVAWAKARVSAEMSSDPGVYRRELAHAERGISAAIEAGVNRGLIGRLIKEGFDMASAGRGTFVLDLSKEKTSVWPDFDAIAKCMPADTARVEIHLQRDWKCSVEREEKVYPADDREVIFTLTDFNVVSCVLEYRISRR